MNLINDDESTLTTFTFTSFDFVENQFMIYILISLGLFTLACFTNPIDRGFHEYLNQISLYSIHSQQHSHSHSHSSHSKLKLKSKSKSKQFTQQSSSSSNQKLSFKLSTPNYFKFNFLLGTLIFIKNYQSLSSSTTSTSNFKTFLGCFGSWFTLDLIHNLNQIKFNLQSFDLNRFLEKLKLAFIRFSSQVDGLLNLIHLKFTLNQIEESESDRISSLSIDSHQELNFSQSSAQEVDSADDKTEDDELRFKDEKFEEDDDQKEEFETKQNPANFEPITTDDSQRIELDDTKFPISSVDHHDLTSPKIPKPMKLSPESTIREDEVEVIDSHTSKLITEDHQEVEKVQILTIEEELNQSHNPINLIPKQKKSKSKSKSHQETKDSNERVAISETEIKLNAELNSIQFKKNEEDLKKLHFKSSLKHLNEIKDLKEFKRRNLNEKLNQFKLMHNNLIIKSKSYQNDLKALDFKEDCIKFSYKEDFKLIKTEEIKLKLDLDKMEDEIENLNHKFEEKQHEVMSLKESLKEKKVKLKLKKQQSKLENTLTDSDSIESKPKVIKIFTNPNRPRSNTNTNPTNSNSTTNPRIEEIKTHPKPNRSNHQFKSLSTTLNQEFSNRTIIPQETIPRPMMEFIPIIQSIPITNLNPWEPISSNHSPQDPWTEEIQEHIKDNFSTLPNLERSLMSKTKSASFSSPKVAKPCLKNSIDLKYGGFNNSTISPFGPIGSTSNSTASSPIIHHGLNPLPSQLLLFPTSLPINPTTTTTEFGSGSTSLDSMGFSDPKPASRLERLKKSKNGGQDHSVWDSSQVDVLHQSSSLIPNLISSSGPLESLKSRRNSNESNQTLNPKPSFPCSTTTESKSRKSEPISTSLTTTPEFTPSTNNPSLSLNPFAKSFKFEGKSSSSNSSSRKKEERRMGEEIDWIDEALFVQKETGIGNGNGNGIGIGIGKFGAIGCSKID